MLRLLAVLAKQKAGGNPHNDRPLTQCAIAFFPRRLTGGRKGTSGNCPLPRDSRNSACKRCFAACINRDPLGMNLGSIGNGELEHTGIVASRYSVYVESLAQRDPLSELPAE